MKHFDDNEERLATFANRFFNSNENYDELDELDSKSKSLLKRKSKKNKNKLKKKYKKNEGSK